ncbi:hypothetical protein MHYP_G00017310 [Metynnis hypsauchen]
MLLKVKYQGTKKYIRLHSGFTYLDFISEVKNKFGIPGASELYIFDESDTAMEEDILLELMEANPDLCLTVRRIPSRKHKEKYALGIITLFPSLRDPFSPKGYLNQDFVLLFGEETSSRLLEKWDTTFKLKVIEESKHLTKSTELHRLLNAAEKHAEDDDANWDSDMASLLLLLHLLPPTAGRKRIKISASDAVDKMVHFHKSCCSIDEHLRGREGKQPYILAVGRAHKRIDTFYIVVDKQLIPCQATRSLGAFDELFKSHYVFNLSYEESLVHFYTFVQTTVYSIDITTTDESPRVRQFRAKLFN